MSGRPRVDVYWEQRIRALSEINPKVGSGAIQTALEQEAARLGRDDPPSKSSVSRIIRRHRSESEQERRVHRQFFWPESCQRGDLPPEAGRAGLELLHFLWTKWRLRPTVRSVRWFWVVSEAAPDAPVVDRFAAARRLATFDILGSLATEGRSVESWFARKPGYGSATGIDGYSAALLGSVTIPVSSNLPLLKRALEAFSGGVPDTFGDSSLNP
jgi:hypothetical protein